MHLVRDLCGCQVSLVPSKAMFDSPGAGDWNTLYPGNGHIPIFRPDVPVPPGNSG